jgi:hypothetical protein
MFRFLSKRIVASSTLLAVASPLQAQVFSGDKKRWLLIRSSRFLPRNRDVSAAMDFDREKMTSNDTLQQNSASGSASGVSTPIYPMEPRDWDDDDDVEKSMERDGDRHGDLSRTKSAISIAETLSLPREIAFVGVICMANFMTR